MSQDILIDGVSMIYGGNAAVDNVTLDIRAGEFFSILGPSGCGKTTLLRLLSGFIMPTKGRILIGGRDMVGIGPNQRPTAMIFQSLALFPLMSVWENVTFGLEVRGIAKPARQQRAAELLDLIGMPDAALKKVSDLSGGQRQRVAIARALAVEPQVMLLDEPLSALDLKLRQHMRAELQSIQRRTGVTFVYITHDQGEALAMSDRVAVMSKGRVEQVAPPQVLYDAPSTPFVAGFVGEVNAIAGRVAHIDGATAAFDTPAGRLVARNPAGLAAGAQGTLFVRPEALLAAEGSAVNSLSCTTAHTTFEGGFAHVSLTAPGGTSLTMRVTNDGRLAQYPDGAALTVRFAPEQAYLLPGAAVSHA
jgi:spermidine/putrescine transport system ATP-binding protein